MKTLWLSRRYSLTYWAKLYQPNPSACQRAGRHRRLGCSVDNSENLPLCSSGCHTDGSGRPSVGLTSEISWKVSELEEGFSVRKPNSAKFSGDSELDTHVNGCPVPLDFRKRVVYSTYTRTRRQNSPGSMDQTAAVACMCSKKKAQVPPRRVQARSLK